MKFKLLLSLILLSLMIDAPAQVFSWVLKSDNCSDSPGNTDAFGNTYKLVYSDNATGVNGDTVFIAKYNILGQLQWKIPTEAEMYHMLRVDPAGNVYFVCARNYVSDPFFAKYSPQGTLIWKDSSTAVNGDGYLNYTVLEDMQIDSDGNMYVSGGITRELKIQGKSFFNKIDKQYNMNDCFFLIKFNKDGLLEWGIVPDNKSEEEEYNRGGKILIDESGNVYTHGWFSGKTVFNDVAVFPHEGYGTFVLKSTAEGKVEWVTTYSGFNWEDACINYDGNISFPKMVPYHIPNYYDYMAEVSTPSVPKIVYRINSGGPEIADSYLNWAADYQTLPTPYLNPFSSNHTTGTAHAWRNVNTTGAPDRLFGPNRYQIWWGGQLAYNFPVVPGTYRVNLYFAEKPTEDDTTGQRIFDVNIEEHKVLESFDIYATAGLAAIKKSFVLYVSDHSLDVTFDRIIGNPMVNGVEIIAYHSDEIPELPVVTSAIPSNSTNASGFYVVSPVSENIVIKSSAQSQSGVFDISVYNQTGETIYQESINYFGEEVIIPEERLSRPLAPGLYIIKINDQTLKFVR